MGDFRNVFPVLPKPLIVKYAFWLCQFRWLFIAWCVAFFALGYFPGVLQVLRLRTDTTWTLVIALLLAVLNTGYLLHLRRVSRSDSLDGSVTNIWIQIVLDLIMLTVVVHFIGSLETYVPFVYLFHIVLACIFFPRLQSLRVTLFASLLFVSCVVVEKSGFLSSPGIFADHELRYLTYHAANVPFINVSSVLVIWATVWYLTSYLTEMVRKREYELVRSYWFIENNLKEKTSHILRTTHELKSPFAAILANVQLLLDGHCGVLTGDVASVLRRISLRCGRLSHEIREMLQLSNIRSCNNGALRWAEIDLAEVLRWSIVQVQPLADERSVSIVTDVGPVIVDTVEEYVKIMMINLLTNAVVYSRNGGQIKVLCRYAPGGFPEVMIIDEGIGIKQEKLPHIFDEYYRTDEAVAHNKGSSGLGLTIVRDAARLLHVRVKVESTVGDGTHVTLVFPFAPEEIDENDLYMTTHSM